MTTETMPATRFGHPPGLFVLFFAEMWERFSYYGMRALLILYLTKHWLFEDGIAAGIFATYGSLVYLTPVIGGLIADRFLGFRRAVIVGAVLLVIGHIGMAIEGAPAVIVDGVVARDESVLQVFYLSLAFIIVGVGFLKPSISSIVGQLYGEGDTRRDAGFTLFYMGINLGAFLATIICGYLGETYGWAYGFGTAGIGMLLGLVTFVRWQHLLEGAGEPVSVERLSAPALGRLSLVSCIYLGAALAVVVSWWLVQNQAVVGQLLGATGIAVIGGIVWFAFRQCTSVERDRLLVLLLLTGTSVLFWALFEQAGSSMSLFADRVVDRDAFGGTVPASMLQSLNPVFIILVAPAFAFFWVRLAAAGREPSAPVKFALALLQVGLGFLALVVGISNVGGDGKVALGWLVLAYFLHTTGELCLSPVGLSMVTKLSVARVVGLMMGVWFLASSAAHYVAGIIAQMASVEGGAGAAAEDSLSVYGSVFELVAMIAIITGLALFVLSPLLRRLMHEDRAQPSPGLQQTTG